MVWGCGCQGLGEVAAARNLGEGVMVLMGGPATLGNRGQLWGPGPAQWQGRGSCLHLVFLRPAVALFWGLQPGSAN